VQLAFFGGVYNNYLALEEAVHDARSRGADQLFCLGDLGAFGPQPDRVFPLLHDAGVTCIQGNYDDSIGNDLEDCQCGYTDPRDNHFAQISYDYTYKNTSADNRRWLQRLPAELRFELDGVRFLLCHGSPRQTNEFLWESTTSTQFLDRLADDTRADIVLATHTGIHWERALSEGRRFVNVGVLGRPENDGSTNVWYTIVSTGADAGQGSGRAGENPKPTGTALWEQDNKQLQFNVEFIPLAYDHQRLAREMHEEQLPPEFVETILTGWWTTCLEVLPSRERRRGKW
jgi:predicted phosphodiesterase